MKKSLIALAVLASIGCIAPATKRARTRDVAFTYRMGAGFPGDVNRTHPASVLPGLMDTADPVAMYGFPVLDDATDNTYRGFTDADDAVTVIDGVLVRPFPTQQTSGGMTSTIGAATPPVGPAVIDVLDDGFILTRLSDFAAASPVKGGPVYVWTAASAGNHVLGGFEAVATGGSSTAAIVNARFNGPPDANGVCEIQVWPAN